MVKHYPRGPIIPYHKGIKLAPAANMVTTSFFGISVENASILPCTGVQSVINVEQVEIPSGQTLIAYWVSILTAAGASPPCQVNFGLTLIG